MNRLVVGRASRLPSGRLAPQLFARETPAKTAGTAAPTTNRQGSWSPCMRESERGFPEMFMNPAPVGRNSNTRCQAWFPVCPRLPRR